MGPGPHPPALTGATPAEAAQLIVAAVRPLPAELRTLRDALDLVTADDISSPIDLPPWTNSAMDGFACRSADVRAGVVLRVVETIAAGQFPQHTLAAGEAARILRALRSPPAPTASSGRRTPNPTATGSRSVTRATRAGTSA